MSHVEKSMVYNRLEELDADKRRRIVQGYLQKFLKTDPNLYYASTADIARSLHLTIKEHINRLPIEEQKLFRNLTIRDVEVILSFH